MRDKLRIFLCSETAKQLYKIIAFLFLWFVFLKILQHIGLINPEQIDQNIFLVINAGVFLFSLLASPATFEISFWGIKIGANKPGHIHFTKTKEGLEIRDFQNKWAKKEIKKIIENQN